LTESALPKTLAARPASTQQLGPALKQRQRQLMRVPSEIYPAAMLDGQALFRANKFDDSAVAYLAALKQRPSDRAARKYRAEALTKNQRTGKEIRVWW